MTKEDQNALIEISTVARLTGLTTANIRMWEKRYNVVEPGRTETQRRLYSEQDLKRLTLLKTLVDHGHPIRSVASLNDSELEERLRETLPVTKKSSNGRSRSTNQCQIAVIGYSIWSMLEDTPLKDAQIVVNFDDLETAEAAYSGETADLLIVECPALFNDTAEKIRRLLKRSQAIRAVIIYHYAQNRALELLDQFTDSITAIRGPVNQAELHLACAADIALAKPVNLSAIQNAPPLRQFSETVPNRAYSDKQLAQISMVSSAIDCECPKHMAGLLTNLLSFEKYSAECSNRNAADAEMHAYLYKTTAHARALIEDALQVLVEFEEIEVSVE